MHGMVNLAGSLMRQFAVAGRLAIGRNVRIAAGFPAKSHTPITRPIARLATLSHPDAPAFESLLHLGEGQAVLRRSGFEPG